MFKFLLLGLLAFAVCEGTPVHQPADLQPYLFEEIIDAIKKAIEFVLNTISAILAGLKDLAQTLIQEALKKLVEQIEEIKNEISKQIAEYLKQAEELGIDISECIKANEDELKAIPEDMINEAAKCRDVQLAKAEEFVQAVKDEVNKVTTDIAELQKRWSECKDIVCRAQVIKDAGDLLSTIGTRLNNVINEFKELVESLKEELPVCITNTLNKAIERATNLSATLKKCVEDKLQEGNQGKKLRITLY